jgi:hypothetical protein
MGGGGGKSFFTQFCLLYKCVRQKADVQQASHQLDIVSLVFLCVCYSWLEMYMKYIKLGNVYEIYYTGKCIWNILNWEMYMKYIKGIVRRKLRWVKSGINQ